MPNYKYACDACGGSWTVAMSISSDPKEKITCRYLKCNGIGSRRIIGGNFNIGKETLGKWYKKNTGKDLF